MDIAILGASGRVGKRLAELVLDSGEDKLSGAYVSDSSRSLGGQVRDTDLVYESKSVSSKRPSDLIIDFSTPAATMSILEDVDVRTRALVIGTTGFTQDENQEIENASRLLPIMVGANFAESFEPFVAACRELAAAYPAQVPQLEETYHRHKKASPSGTSLRLAREITEARRAAGCDDESEIPIKVHREGDVVGEHVCSVNTGQTESVIRFSVNGLDTFARGAMLAGRWLLGKPPGLYVPGDILKSKSQGDRECLPD